MERPFGITLLASFFFIQSVINLFLTYGFYITGASILGVGYYFIDSVAGLVFAYGMWKGLTWGRIGTMALSGVEIVIGLLGTILSLDFEASDPVQALTKVVVYALVIYFLTRPEIKEWFNK